MTEQEFQTFLRSIRPADRAAMDAAARRQAELAKPPGSLGTLEDISIRLAGLTGRVKNRIDRCRVLVFAADNGVTAEGVSATPVSVTLSQSINMTRHITGMSALAAAFGDSVVVTDVGIDADVRCPEIVDRKIRRSTGDIAREPAMTREQALTAISVGMEQAQRAAQDGMQAVGIGEMGIGNTTTSAAVLAALTGLAPEELTGRGAGLTDDAFRKKKDVIRRADGLQIIVVDGGLRKRRHAIHDGAGGLQHLKGERTAAPLAQPHAELQEGRKAQLLRSAAVARLL